MRYYIDTNVLAFLCSEDKESISRDVSMLFENYANTFLTSSVCVQELIHIIQIGKVKGVRPENVIEWLKETAIKIVPPTEKHLQTLSELPMVGDHRDPCDRLIIAQSMSDRIPVITSDRKFSWYKRLGLSLVFNDR